MDTLPTPDEMPRSRFDPPARALPMLGAALALLLLVVVTSPLRHGVARVGLAVAEPPAATLSGDLGAATPTVPDAPLPRAEPPSAAPVRAPRTLLVRTVGPLPDALLDEMRSTAGASTVALVTTGQVQLLTGRAPDGRALDAPPPGFVIPLATIGVDTDAYSRLLPPPDRDRVRLLGPGEALLGSTSARLRRLTAGGALQLSDGRLLRVVGVLDDGLIGAAEVVVSRDTASSLGVDVPEYALVADASGNQATPPAVASLAAGFPGTRVEELGPAPWRASWRAVLPQAVMKQRFGEIAIAPATDALVTLDPAWAQENLVTTTVALLGPVTCHRAMLPALVAAMAEVERRGLAGVVDPADFQGCYNPVLRVPPATLSAHAWGLAVDINASANPDGSPSRQDPRLVEIMEAHGFVAGARWPVPDPMHFEYRG